MTITTLSVGVAVTPTVVNTFISHYTSRSSRRQKPTAHISYDEGLHLIRSFLSYASHKTVDEVQSFTANIVPHPPWVRTEDITITTNFLTEAADIIIANVGEDGIQQIGGRKWWQWRQNASPLRAEWIEMKADHSERIRTNAKSDRVMFYVHGGGYFFGSVDEHRYQLQRHARKLNARVLAPRYRLAPQFPFPCGLQDCLAVYLYLLTVNDPTEIIFAGDSAGGGMVLSMMCLLRDHNLPLPAGAVLISPWVDLTHSFPSVDKENPLDYLPTDGFHHKPSISWPPLSEDEFEALNPNKSQECPVLDQTATLTQAQSGQDAPVPTARETSHVDPVPRQNHHLSVEADGTIITIKDQTQMYTTNQLISHPLVSPVLQPSLGGLPPLLVLAGGGELLRDEQIYVAHKAANPQKYSLGPQYRAKYDPGDKILNKYPPTPVQLQVWEDLCHAAPTLSFTRPVKYMYRSIAQFGAWALARAQRRPIEIADDDNISVISSNTSASSRARYRRNIGRKGQTIAPQTDSKSIGKAGDPIPTFHNHMIRQQVDRHGIISPLPAAEELPATSMDSSEVGIVKPGPVKRWLATKRNYESRYAVTKTKVHKLLLRRISQASKTGFDDGENPPPSALARRRTADDELPSKVRKSYGLAMWSGWGSRHDEETIKREERIVGNGDADVKDVKDDKDGEDGKDGNDKTVAQEGAGAGAGPQEATELLATTATTTTTTTTPMDSVRKVSNSLGVRNSASASRSRSRTRMRTVSVTDRGQAEGSKLSADGNHGSVPLVAAGGVAAVTAATAAVLGAAHTEQPTANHRPVDSRPITSASATTNSDQTQSPNPIFLPKYKTVAHLGGGDSKPLDYSDTASTATGPSMISVSDHASTMAVFSAPGISKDTKETGEEKLAGTFTSNASTTATMADTTEKLDTPSFVHGSDTPASRRSLERLQTNNQLLINSDGGGEVIGGFDDDKLITDKKTLLSGPSLVVHSASNPSTMSLVDAEGVAPIVTGAAATAAAAAAAAAAAHCE